MFSEGYYYSLLPIGAAMPPGTASFDQEHEQTAKRAWQSIDSRGPTAQSRGETTDRPTDNVPASWLHRRIRRDTEPDESPTRRHTLSLRTYGVGIATRSPPQTYRSAFSDHPDGFCRHDNAP